MWIETAVLPRKGRTYQPKGTWTNMDEHGQTRTDTDDVGRIGRMESGARNFGEISDFL
jgi:hypothetical protein